VTIELTADLFDLCVKLTVDSFETVETVLFQLKQNAKTAVKYFSWCSQSQPVSAVHLKMLSLVLSIKLL